MYCPNCGTMVSEKKKFCAKCGAPMPAAPSFSSAGVHSSPTSSSVPGAQTQSTLLDKFFDMSKTSMQQSKPASKQTYNIIWFAMFMALHIYVVVSYLVGMGKESMNTNPPIVMLPIISIIACFSLIAGIIAIKLQITPDKIRKYDNATTAMQYIQTVGIVGMAMIESVSVFGLVLYFIRFKIYYFYAFYAASLIAIVWSRISVEPAWRFIESNPAWKIAREK